MSNSKSSAGFRQVTIRFNVELATYEITFIDHVPGDDGQTNAAVDDTYELEAALKITAVFLRG